MICDENEFDDINFQSNINDVRSFAFNMTFIVTGKKNVELHLLLLVEYMLCSLTPFLLLNGQR